MKIGVAPNGCSITTNGTTESLPKGFFGFMFNMQFGDTTLNVATQVSDEGFVFDAEIDNLTLAGITYTQVALKIEIDESGSAVSFSGAMDSDLGSAAIDWFVTNDSYNGRRQFLSGSVTNWKAARAGTFEVPSFSFSATSRFGGNNACSSFSASAQGQLKLQAKTYTLKRASFELTCEGLQNLDLAVDMEHEMNGGGTAVAEFRVSYLNDKYLGKSLIAGASFEYTKYNSWEYLSRTFGRHIDISIEVGIMVQYANTASAEFTFGGGFDADRVGGSLDCEWTSSGQDFRCSGKVKVNPEWADKYVESWGDL
jgi:hypothetical protein